MNLKKPSIVVDLHTAVDAAVVGMDGQAGTTTEAGDRDVGTLLITAATCQDASLVDLNSTGRGTALKDINVEEEMTDQGLVAAIIASLRKLK